MMRELLKRLTFICLLFASIMNPVKAQYHFQRATIWLLNGDSVNGWLQGVGLNMPSNEIRFKKNEKDKKSEFYTSANVKAYKLDHKKKYIGYVGTIDSVHGYMVTKYTLINPSGIKDSLFLDPLVLGKVNLYYATDHRNIKHFFIQVKNRPVEELHYYRIEWAVPGVDIGIFHKQDYHLVERNIYKQQLLSAFSDCNEIFKKLADSPIHYTKSNLRNWFLKYNSSPCNAE